MIKRIILVILIVVFLAGIAPLIKYLNSGHLIIGTDKSNAVLIEKISNGERSVVRKQKGPMSQKLPAGQYYVTVSKSSFQVTQAVNVKRLQTARLNINPETPSPVEPVLDASGFNLAISKNTLRFIDYEDGGLYNLNGQNTLTALLSGKRFTSISWVTSTHGLGQDDSNKLYLIRGDSVEPIDLPASGDFENKLLSVAGDDNTIFVSDGKAVYRGDFDGNYEQIYISDTEKMSLKAVGDTLLVLEIEDYEEGVNPDPKVVHINKENDVKDSGFSAVDVEISQDAEYFSLNTGEAVVIVDKRLDEIRVLPSDASTRMNWVDSETLLFTREGELWSYNINLQRSSLIANTPLSSLILEIEPDAQGEYVYIVTSSGAEFGDQIKRVGLKSQKINKSVLNLQEILPVVDNNCRIRLINFEYPTITTTPLAGRNNCVEITKNFFTGRLIGIKGVDVRNVEVLEGD